MSQQVRRCDPIGLEIVRNDIQPLLVVAAARELSARVLAPSTRGANALLLANVAE